MTRRKKMAEFFGKVSCTYCQEEINSVRVQCCICPDFDICLQCFSVGAEIGPHRNDHAYKLVDHCAVSIFGGRGGWTGVEHLSLLNAVELYGFGNWELVSEHVETRTPEEVKDEYIARYFEGNIGKATWAPLANHKQILVDHVREDTGPLSPNVTARLPPLEISPDEARILGYKPHRDDYEVEYDMESEQLVSKLSYDPEEDTEMEIALKLAMEDMYARRLRERARRKRLVRDYQLVAKFFKNIRTDAPKPPMSKEHKELYEKLRVFAQYLSSGEHDRLIASIERERELRHRLSELLKYRSLGLSTQEEIIHYERHAAFERQQKMKQKSVESGYGTGSENSLKRHGSTVSLQSTTFSTASGSSFKRSSRNIREKLAEIETFKDILCRQIDTLQKYFDFCMEHNAHNCLPDKENLPVVDFKGEAITFKTTTAAVIDTLEHCADLVTQREESWRKRLDKEVERRKRAEALSNSYFAQIQKIRNVHPGPDLEEGPHSVLADDEFYDAVESGLDKIEEEQELRERLKSGKVIPVTPPPISPASQHRLWSEIEKTVKDQVTMARMGIGECGSGWQLFAEDGEMKMYRREEEVDGMVVDPLKAVHVVKGITGHEVCHYFFSPQYRYDWETTLEQMTVLETISEDTLIFLQTHKRIWPASQRDVLFWSHMRKLPNEKDREGPDIWTVVNNSTEHTDHPPNVGKCVRVYLKVCLLCQTRVDPPKDGAPITRDNVSCKITYCSVVNPGEWAPASVLRALLYKRQYPKFLKRFTAYVINQTKSKAIMF